MTPTPSTGWADLPVTDVIGTNCTVTDKYALLPILEAQASTGPWSIDFTNVQIVTMRRTETAFRETTASVDAFIPDSQILRWAVNLCGGDMKQRVYGPEFLAHAIAATAPGTRHYFLGGSPLCLEQLLQGIRRQNPALTVVGSHNGYFKEHQNEEVILDILKTDPDFIWVGLGTPKQQEWINAHKSRFPRGVLLAVGFAFDVNAGTKKDAPRLMQKLGLTWLFRLLSEPRRLFVRYTKYNSLFLWHLARQLLRI